MGDRSSKKMTKTMVDNLEGHYIQCACTNGGQCYRTMHLKGTQCDREVFLTKSSRHRICKGCRSEKRSKRDHANSQKVQAGHSNRGRPRKNDDIREAAAALGNIHADVTSSDEDSNLDSNSQESKNRGDVDALYILAAESVSASHPFRASQTRSSSRIQHLRHYKEEDDDEDNTYDDNINELKGEGDHKQQQLQNTQTKTNVSSAEEIDHSASHSLSAPKGPRRRGRPRKDETNGNLSYASISADSSNPRKRSRSNTAYDGMTKITSTLMGMRAKEAKDSPTLRTRNGDDVRLLPCACPKGGYCHRPEHASGVACDNICRISRTVRHRVCKACRSGGRKKAGNNNNAPTKVTKATVAEAVRPQVSIQNPENLHTSEDMDALVDFSLKAASNVVAMFANADDDSPRSFGLITPGGGMSARNQEMKEEEVKDTALRADEDSEVEVLANVEEAPLTRDDSGIIMLRQPECIESSLNFAEKEKSLLSKLEGGPITYSNVATPRDAAVELLGAGHEGKLDIEAMSEKMATLKDQITFSLKRPEEAHASIGADAVSTEVDGNDDDGDCGKTQNRNVPLVTLPDGVTPRTVTAVTEGAALLGQDA